MKKELFIKKVKSRGGRIIPSDEPIFNAYRAIDFKELKQFIRYIDFDCQIGKSGGCKETHLSSLKCCCHDCLWGVGYLRQIIDTDVSYYAKHFSVKTGFWRKGKGCILPHKMRSVTCLTHHCNHTSKKYPGFGEGISIIKDKLIHLRGEI